MVQLAQRAPVRLVALLVGVIAIGSACLPFNSQEEYVFHHTNDLRAANHLNALAGMDELTTRARQWAQTLAARGQLAHSDLRSLGIAWTAVAENVGRSTTIEDVFRRLQDSPQHRANMLDNRWSRMGVGTARAKDGTVYAVQIFWRG